MFDLAVAYRIYPGVSKAPALYPDDKYRLSEFCLRSFKSACGSLKIKMWVILDGCPPEYEQMFRDILRGFDLEVLSPNKLGNAATFSLQIDLLTRQSEAEFVFFAEDDYFYFPNALEKMVAFLCDNPDADFVTPYDHPDSYFTSSRHERHHVKPYGDRYWRTASSTCLTFLTTRKTLISTARIFRTYSAGNMDCPIWLALTQRTELASTRVHFSDWFRTKTWIRIWRWGLRQVLFSRRYYLWAPLPTLGTHMESTCLSPLVDWQSVFAGATNMTKAREPIPVVEGVSRHGI